MAVFGVARGYGIVHSIQEGLILAAFAGCAVLVSIGSWWMVPRSFITFGVLHGIAVMLIVVRFTTSWGIGARFHGPTFTALRLELARGREGWLIVAGANQPF